MNRNVHILTEVTRDWVTAIVLFLVACAGSGWCQQNLTPNIDVYLTWFTLWMIPFILYGKFRGIFDNGGREVAVQFFTVIATVQLLHLFFPNMNRWLVNGTILVSLIAGYFLGCLCFSDRGDETKARHAD